MSLRKEYRVKDLIKELSLKKELSNFSYEFKERQLFKPPVCSIFNKKLITTKTIKEYQLKVDINSQKQLWNIVDNHIKGLFELQKNETSKNYDDFPCKQRIGIVFSGGPAPGGHNVIAGLFDALKKANPESVLFGFLMGPDGMIEGNYIQLESEIIDKYRNLGGFNMIKTGRAKIDSSRKIRLVKKNCKELNLTGIVIVGGDDSNTNAAFLAHEMFDEKICVIGVPKTIDGDIQVKDINNKILCATTFGFHTAAKSFSYSVGNLCVDAGSDAKYWHICKIMGRVAGHLALEVAFQTHANLTLIGEELSEYIDNHKLQIGKTNIDCTTHGMTLDKVVDLLCDAVIKRAKIGKKFGVIVIPEGILEFINETQILITKLNLIISNYNLKKQKNFSDIYKTLDQQLAYIKGCSTWNKKDHELFIKMPELLQKGLLTERDNHGNFQFSQVKTEDAIFSLMKKRLDKLQKEGKYIIGIKKNYYKKIMKKNGLNEKTYGPILFGNWGKDQYFLFNHRITSEKILLATIKEANIKIDKLPKPIENLFKMSRPNFKVQTHSYGYEGRGANPTYFDSTYAYNLGQTAFHLINNGVTGQMASILNLEDKFEHWKPIGIPIAALMHLEERNGKPSLVLKKSTLDTKSPAFNVFKYLRTSWLASESGVDQYKAIEPIKITKANNDEKPITLLINNSS